MRTLLRRSVHTLPLLLTLGCGGGGGDARDAAADVAQEAGPVVLGEGVYRGVCDGSATERIGEEHLFSLNDETQTWRVFRASADGTAVQSGSFGTSIGVADEVDIEGSTRIGDRIYVTGSHGRDKNGNLELNRFRFFALDISGTAPELTVTAAGYTSTLFHAMLVGANYTNDDADLRALLADRSHLEDPSDANLAPTVNGVSIEALTALPSSTALAIGFRNPLAEGDAIMVTLTNAPDVITGATPVFGDIFTMDLGGLGFRAMTFDAERNLVWLIAGPTSGAEAPFALYRWSGVIGEAPVMETALTPPAGAAAESVMPVAGTSFLRILFDASASLYGEGVTCKEIGSASRYFTESIVTVD
jgi:hypothetical protein